MTVIHNSAHPRGIPLIPDRSKKAKEASYFQQKDVWRCLPWIAAALTTASIVYCILFQKKSPEQKCNTHTTLTIPGDSSRILSHTFKTCKEIDTMPEMYGQTWADIEQRVNDTNIFGGRSLRKKLQQDCKVVLAAGTTFDELADHIEALSSLLEEKHDKNCQNSKWVEFFYNPANRRGSTLGTCSQTPAFNGWRPTRPQPACDLPRKDIFHLDSYGHFWRIRNSANRVEISFSKTKFLEHLRNGFIDGTDAASLIALVTGDSSESIRHATDRHTTDTQITKSLYDAGTPIPNGSC